MPTLNPSHFRPVHKHQVNFDHPHKAKSIPSPTLKSSQFWSPTLKPGGFWTPRKNQVDSGAPTEAKSFWDKPVDAWRRSPVGKPPKLDHDPEQTTERPNHTSGLYRPAILREGASRLTLLCRPTTKITPCKLSNSNPKYPVQAQNGRY